MKKLSITAYITIWYAIFMIVVVGILIGIITYTGNENTNEKAKVRIQTKIVDLSDEIRFSKGDFVLNDDIRYADDSVFLSVYDKKGNILEGYRPIQIVNYPKFKDDQLYREEDIDGFYWYIYDRKINDIGENHKDIWIRGVTKDQTNTANGAGTDLLSSLIWVLIVIVLIAVIGGLVMARNALRPVRNMIGAVDDIREDGDLSRRIEPGRRRDEIYQLAESFNGMFDSLEEMIEKEKQFTSDVSHELRTPLAVIISSSDYALENEEYRQKGLGIINKEAKRMNSLVNRLLTLSRSDKGVLPMSYEKIDLSEICGSVAEQQAMLATDKNIRIVADLEPNLYVECDEGFIIRALLNLVDNAMEYGVKAEDENAEIRISLKKDGQFAEISVSDNGHGIPKDQIDRIWDRFYRADTSRSDKGSSGLGLSMVEAIAKSHGGSARVVSEEGKGSTFTVRIPLRQGGGR